MRKKDHHKALAGLAVGVLAVLLLVVLAIAVQGTEAGKAEPAPLDWTSHQVTAHRIAEQLRAQGYDESNPVIRACQDWWREERNADTSSVTAGAVTPSPQGEGKSAGYVPDAKRYAYPVAARVWTLLREAGLSEACTAGILGNMMAECGGQTLSLAPDTYSSGYYGLCMWSLYYFPEADGLGVDDQVALLLRTLESNISAGGGSYAAFLASADARSAARYFSDFYERPATWASVRADNAELAQEYFGGGGNG